MSTAIIPPRINPRSTAFAPRIPSSVDVSALSTSAIGTPRAKTTTGMRRAVVSTGMTRIGIIGLMTEGTFQPFIHRAT